ncbi:DUF3888 domain-containing protein [Clostridium tetani]|uniref:DUF3888 domain-containing protein n=1 Tax=Clostridium tetani TaxID=1513 RepID=A0ABC8EA20_CLOTA|nr:DUF3888 domain-containing protein [Clostridium tetani]CDI48501.1 hypothetical protein BN906_00466 [Clostridium tetani 12124569]RXI40917.1 DUF3888 domain-containing protein [Clostridium tetani]RXI58666.1 DUF3888 domain-containing protein [Clostridium tetani]RXI73380.1 DUF3888 domain-containing protein [Clostridium tetani]RXI74918.1 DUF3888 domain-containing protein [Clostridium tetani]
MKKKTILVTLFIFILVQTNNVYSAKQINENVSNEKIQASIYKDSILVLLYPYMTQAVTDYYGVPRQFDLTDAKILSITKPNKEVTEYYIIVQVETFTGAHNPPRGIETITISTSPVETKIINYKHISE